MPSPELPHPLTRRLSLRPEPMDRSSVSPGFLHLPFRHPAPYASRKERNFVPRRELRLTSRVRPGFPEGGETAQD